MGEKVFLLEPKGNRFLAVTPLAHHYEYYLESIRATRKSVMPGKKFLNDLNHKILLKLRLRIIPCNKFQKLLEFQLHSNR